MRILMQKQWTPVLGSVGAIVSSLLACAGCPACLPIYAGLLSLLGFELFELNAYFLPVMLIFLTFTLGSMGFQVLRRRADLRPLAIASAAAVCVIFGALQGYEYLLYASLAAFMGSVFWNKSLSRKAAPTACC